MTKSSMTRDKNTGHARPQQGASHDVAAGQA
jgi:hypothetical protein